MSGNASVQIQSTAGAVAIKNEKGELSMQKVKVHRYVSGKRPDYAPVSSSEEDSEAEDFTELKLLLTSNNKGLLQLPDRTFSQPEDISSDPRLRRLQAIQGITTIKCRRHDAVATAETTDNTMTHEENKTDNTDEQKSEETREDKEKEEDGDGDEEEEEEEELSDAEIERRRKLLREKLLYLRDELDLMETEDEEDDEEGGRNTSDSSHSGSSEDDDTSDAEDSHCPRLKPVFIRKKDRTTILDKERTEKMMKQAEMEAKKNAEERRKQAIKLVEMTVLKDRTLLDAKEASLEDVDTDDENDETEYEMWKLRELKRIKRDKEEREQRENEQLEVEQIRTMTEEERRLNFRANPKRVTNKAIKGKYKFLQKYYHRGSYYMDEEEDLYKRDFSAPTLEDQFDKTVLPKVMQVKNFGRSGRTKYTHLVDQDTTQFDSPWISETALNLKFHAALAPGMKQNFEKPSRRKPNH
ncbi:microfibrillar-associated protein 1-like [Schistocerca cancellata]|uniref:microfibrillar-associated protein 1-like n=1 Tax=Schistocerca cancellata TaxID=274614 RepID=UPI0021193E5C|nr:microfibrillar-associated protein 1-like [Schistocerca cancellata]